MIIIIIKCIKDHTPWIGVHPSETFAKGISQNIVPKKGSKRCTAINESRPWN